MNGKFTMTVAVRFEVPVETAMFILASSNPAATANDWLTTQHPLRQQAELPEWESPHAAEVMQRELGHELARQAIAAAKRDSKEAAMINAIRIGE